MGAIIKWNAERNGVEVKTHDEHFVIDAQPSRVMSRHDVVISYPNADGWTLPTKKQLLLVAKHISKVNALLEQHGGNKLFGWHLSIGEANEFRAWDIFPVFIGTNKYYCKLDAYYVRPVFSFQNYEFVVDSTM